MIIESRITSLITANKCVKHSIQTWWGAVENRINLSVNILLVNGGGGVFNYRRANLRTSSTLKTYFLWRCHDLRILVPQPHHPHHTSILPLFASPQRLSGSNFPLAYFNDPKEQDLHARVKHFHESWRSQGGVSMWNVVMFGFSIYGKKTWYFWKVYRKVLN